MKNLSDMLPDAGVDAVLGVNIGPDGDSLLMVRTDKLRDLPLPTFAECQAMTRGEVEDSVQVLSSRSVVYMAWDMGITPELVKP